MGDIRDPNQHGWRLVARNFSPAWFTVNMGTGIVSLLLFQLPYNGDWVYWLSVVVFTLNVGLFILFLGISLTRYIGWPELWTAMIRHPVQGLFLGAFSAGLGTVTNMIFYICVPAWGHGVIFFPWALWILESAISVGIVLVLPFVSIRKKGDISLSTITALQLFPAIAPLVSSVVAGTAASALASYHPQLALGTILTGYVLWGLGFPLALSVMVVYYQRLVIHKFPNRDVIVSTFLPVGPPALGAYAVLELGFVASKVFPVTNTIHPLAGVILYNLGVITALIFWGYAVLWLFLAGATVWSCRSDLRFNLSWWGFTFPIGCFAVSSVRLGQCIPSSFFKVVGTIVSVCTFLLWAMVSVLTLRDAFSKKLFHDPVTMDFEKAKREVQQNRVGDV